MSTDSIGSDAQAGAKIGRPRLLQRVHEAIRLRHYSRRTEQAYVRWARRFVRFAGLRHPSDLGDRDVTAFLTDLAAGRELVRAGRFASNPALAAPLTLPYPTQLLWDEGLILRVQVRMIEQQRHIGTVTAEVDQFGAVV